MDLSKIFVALDYTNPDDAKKMINKLGDRFSAYKIGHPLFTSSGFEVIDYLKKKNKTVFLDLKFFDIPSVIIKAVQNLVEKEIDFFTVHSLAGERLLNDIARVTENTKTKPLGVTILTSFSQDELQSQLLIEQPFKETMIILINRIKNSGIQGLVCSPREIELVKKITEDLLIVTPGIRLDITNNGDQARTTTPSRAINAGADYLVIGRSITSADNLEDVINLLGDGG